MRTIKLKLRSMKKVVFLVTILGLMVVGCKSKYSDLDDGLYAEIQTDRGDILLQLAYEKAPVTVSNFVSLAEGTNTFVDETYKGKPYYDGIVFHRVVDNFVIQAGDPTATGSGGPGYRFNDEFTDLKHDVAGTLSMANSGPNTNGSQFFVTHRATPNLDGRHSVFGYVVQGQDVVDSIAQGDTINKMVIVRKGGGAKAFDAPMVFSEHFAEVERKAKEQEAALDKVKKDFIATVETQKAQAKELPSGLKIAVLKEGTGPKPTVGGKALVYYAGYLTDGSLFDSNVLEVVELYDKVDPRRKQMNGYTPVPMDYSPEASLIPGFREGLLSMKTGDKVRLFIPSHLGYGPSGIPNVIPPNADLIFDLEIVNNTQ